MFVSPGEAVSVIRSGDTVHLAGVAGVPDILLSALCDRALAGEVRDIDLFHIHTAPTIDFASSRFAGLLRSNSYFLGDSIRKFVHEGCADFIPVSLHEIACLYRDGVVKPDVVMVQVSPPNADGMVSLGTAVASTVAAIRETRIVIAVMNPRVPFTLGEALIPLERLDYIVEDDTPLFTWTNPEPGPVETRIGQYCASIVEDGACLQLGIGSIPNAVLRQLTGHRHLGIHTEMFACGVLPLIESGVIDGSRKGIDRGKHVTSFLMGSQELYDFADNNPDVVMREVFHTNDPFIIAQNPNVVAINSAMEIDLTGQVCADSIGTRIYSGIGGQLDFVYGAWRSPGGKSVIAMAASSKGRSKIVPLLQPGAGVVTPRGRVQYVATEYGIVNLYGRNLQDRARLLISIAAPEHREELERSARERYGAGFKAAT